MASKMQLPKVNQQFRHWKGNVYTVLCFAQDEQNEQILVIHQGEDGRIWSRTIGNFMGLAPIKPVGAATLRFTPVGQ